ncbi:MAG TPA: hypothetical protein VHB02_17640 [Acidimicrobiales bacterium]|nr:hypothetical protein [Acidimicrobiales bacterium]
MHLGEAAAGPVAEIPPIISVDDHVIEPPDLWQRWLPSGLRDRGPKVVEAPFELTGNQPPYVRRAESGETTDFWEYGSLSVAIPGGMVAVGRPPDTVTHRPCGRGPSD